MLALVTIFLATLLISVVAIWFYRTVSTWEGFSSTVVSKRKKTRGTRLKPQRGFISLKMPSRQKVRTVQLRKTTAGPVKAPWGW